MRISKFSALFLVISGCAAQNAAPPGRTVASVDGEAIPETSVVMSREAAVQNFFAAHGREPHGAADEKEIAASRADSVCKSLRYEILRIVEQKEKKRFGIKASPADIERVRRRVLKDTNPNEAVRRGRPQARAVLDALDDVLDRGIDPREVYRRRAAELRMSKDMWLFVVRQSRKQDLRAHYRRMASITPEAYAAGIAAMDVRPQAERDLLDAAVDVRIASQDAEFKRVVPKMREMDEGGRNKWMLAAEYDHVRAKRKAYWDGEYKKTSVVIVAPDLVGACDLSAPDAPVAQEVQRTKQNPKRKR